jgi:elongation factor P
MEDEAHGRYRNSASFGGVGLTGREGKAFGHHGDEGGFGIIQQGLFAYNGRVARIGVLAMLIDAIDVKRRALFEFENTPYYCLEAEVKTPTARGGQTLVRLKIRNLLTNAVFEKTFKAGDKFKEPDLQFVSASYLYSDGAGSHFLDQESYETVTLTSGMMGDALDLLISGTLVELRKYNGNPIGLQMPMYVELEIAYTEPGVRGDSSSGSVTKPARLETGLEIRVPLFIKEGEKIKVSTEDREFAGRV